MKFRKKDYPKEYTSWRQMKRRCADVNRHNYHRYGGKGIKVCDEWNEPHGFQAFMEHIGPKPTPQHTIDRIDSEKNYEPGNVRWQTPYEQTNNRYNTLKTEIGFKNKALTVIELLPSIIKSGRYEKMVRLQCDCGNIVDKMLKRFLYGKIITCGCKIKTNADF